MLSHISSLIDIGESEVVLCWYICFIFLLNIRPASGYYSLTTIAGINGKFTGDHGSPLSSTFYGNRGLWGNVDGDVFIADRLGNRIRKMFQNDGNITTVAGTGVSGFSGHLPHTATNAQVNSPYGVWGDTIDNLYIADSGNSVIRKVSTGGFITTIAGTGIDGFGADNVPATSSEMKLPVGIWGNSAFSLFICEAHSHRIRRVDLAGSQLIATIVGLTPMQYDPFTPDGAQGTSNTINNPLAIWLHTITNELYFADSTHFRIRKMVPDGKVYTVVGVENPSCASVGAATASGVGYIETIFGDADHLYYGGCNMVIKVNHASNQLHRFVGEASVIASGGDFGPASSAFIAQPTGIWATSDSSKTYISDEASFTVRAVASNGIINIVAGGVNPRYYGENVVATSSGLGEVFSIWMDASQNIYFTQQVNARVCKYVSADQRIITVAGNGKQTEGPSSSVATSTSLNLPHSIVGNAAGDLFFTDHARHEIYKVTSGAITVLAGSIWDTCNIILGDGGPATSASLCFPAGLAIDSSNNKYFSDMTNNKVRYITTVGMLFTLIGTGAVGNTGDGGPSTSATLSAPNAVYNNVETPKGMFVSDTGNKRVRKFQTNSVVALVGNSGNAVGFGGEGTAATAASLVIVRGLWSDSLGQLYLTDAYCRLREMNLQNKLNSIANINGECASNADTAQFALTTPMADPNGIVGDSGGMIYLAEYADRQIVKYAVDLTPTVQPTSQPSSNPSISPSCQPSGQPTTAPAVFPTIQPTTQPSSFPSTQPSFQPTSRPSRKPTQQPTSVPSLQPSVPPSTMPSSEPSSQPTQQPVANPTSQPSQVPTAQPSNRPSTQPSTEPTGQPSADPTSWPSSPPSDKPTSQPSQQPSANPSVRPNGIPTAQPSSGPTTQPSSLPSDQPTSQPTQSPSSNPTESPTAQPSSDPSAQPGSRQSSQPSAQPSSQPSIRPTMTPSCRPSSQPSGQPVSYPSSQPTSEPSSWPSCCPTSAPTTQPSEQPTGPPTTQPSSRPTVQPQSNPTNQPTAAPSSPPSGQLFARPSNRPSVQPTTIPTAQPIVSPTSLPSAQPSCVPSRQPSTAPSVHPSQQPIVVSSMMPTCTPSTQPSRQPIATPSTHPTSQPTRQPSKNVHAFAKTSAVGPIASQFRISLPFLSAVLPPSYELNDVILTGATALGGFVVFGSSHMKSGSVHMPLVSSDGFNYTHVPSIVGFDVSGRSVANAGDINGDGYDDLIIGVPNAARRVYVLFGSRNGFVNMTEGFTVFGVKSSDLTGWSVSGAGDMNNDTFADVVFGVPYGRNVDVISTGAAYVLYGGAVNYEDIELGALNANRGFKISGVSSSDSCGMSVSGAGGVNGDGYDDVLIGALRASSLNSGAVYVVFGGPTVALSDIQLSVVDSWKWTAITGPAWSWLGVSLSRAGDANNDGTDDIILGSTPKRNKANDPISYIIFGNRNISSSSISSIMHSDSNVAVVGGGTIVLGIGDIDHDNYNDVVVCNIDVSGGHGLVVYTPVKLPGQTDKPSHAPSPTPSGNPSVIPTLSPTHTPTQPTATPSHAPTGPTFMPTQKPTQPTSCPTVVPTAPSQLPTVCPTITPSNSPTKTPTKVPSVLPTIAPTMVPTRLPSFRPVTMRPTVAPTLSLVPMYTATLVPSLPPVLRPSARPTMQDTHSGYPGYIPMFITVNQTIRRNATASMHYITNNTDTMTVSGRGQNALFTVVPNAEATLRIEYFNVTGDILDLRAFHYLTSFVDLATSVKQSTMNGAVSLVFHFKHSQTVRLFNITVDSLSSMRILYYPIDRTEDSDAVIREEASYDVGRVPIIIGGALCLALIVYLLVVAVYLVIEKRRQDRESKEPIVWEGMEDYNRTFITFINRESWESDIVSSSRSTGSSNSCVESESSEGVFPSPVVSESKSSGILCLSCQEKDNLSLSTGNADLERQHWSQYQKRSGEEMGDGEIHGTSNVNYDNHHKYQHFVGFEGAWGGITDCGDNYIVDAGSRRRVDDNGDGGDESSEYSVNSSELSLFINGLSGGDDGNDGDDDDDDDAHWTNDYDDNNNGDHCV